MCLKQFLRIREFLRIQGFFFAPFTFPNNKQFTTVGSVYPLSHKVHEIKIHNVDFNGANAEISKLLA